MEETNLPAFEEIYEQAFKGTTVDFGLPIPPQIYAAVRRAIIENRLPPKTPIFETKFADILGVSRTPLRSALQQLAKEGLVETRPQIGSFVAPIDRAKIWSSVFCRAALETAVVQRLAQLPDVDFGPLDRNLAAQADLSTGNDYNAFFPIDEAFHALLAAMAGVPEAWQIILSNKTHVDRARIQLQASHPGRVGLAYREHLALVTAIRENDPLQAGALMEVHIRSALDVLDEETASNQSP